MAKGQGWENGKGPRERRKGKAGQLPQENRSAGTSTGKFLGTTEGLLTLFCSTKAERLVKSQAYGQAAEGPPPDPYPCPPCQPNLTGS